MNLLIKTTDELTQHSENLVDVIDLLTSKNRPVNLPTNDVVNLGDNFNFAWQAKFDHQLVQALVNQQNVVLYLSSTRKLKIKHYCLTLLCSPMFDCIDFYIVQGDADRCKSWTTKANAANELRGVTDKLVRYRQRAVLHPSANVLNANTRNKNTVHATLGKIHKANSFAKRINIEIDKITSQPTDKAITLKHIANQLNLKNITTSNGCKFTPMAVKRIMDRKT